MRRLFVVAAALSLPVALVACGDDGGSGSGSGSGSTATDESTDEETISLDDWVEQADEICAENDQEVDDLEEPDFDRTGDLSQDQLDEAADYLDDVAEIEQELVDGLTALPPPDEMAEEAADTLDLVQGAIDDYSAAAEAARDGDQDDFNDQLDSAGEQFGDASESAADLGLQECGQDNGTTGATSDPTGDDPTGSGE